MLTEKGHGGEVFGLTESERSRLLDFSININPLGLSPKGKTALLSSLETDLLRYPDTATRALRRALSARYGVPEEGIVCGNGATELMYAFIRAFHPSAVYVPAPAFSEYRFAAKAAKVPVRSFLLDQANGFAPSDERFLDHLPRGAAVFLGNPNNPDGRLLPRGRFYRFMEAVERAEGWLILDESFIDFVGAGESFRDSLPIHPRLLICQSLTKFYAVPGLRIGVMFSSAEVARQLSAELCPWNVNGLAQRYLEAAVADDDYIEETRDYVYEERSRMELLLSGHPELVVYSGTANFLLLRLRDKDGAWLSEKLMRYGLLIRQCSNYEGLDASFVRVAVRRAEENDRLLSALKEVFAL